MIHLLKNCAPVGRNLSTSSPSAYIIGHIPCHGTQHLAIISATHTAWHTGVASFLVSGLEILACLLCRSETRAEAAKEPLLSSFLYASILSHDTFARSLAFVLANRLSDATMLATELFELFHTLLRYS